MALTQSAWDDNSVNGLLVLTCTVVHTTAETDAYTLKTPKNTIDGTRPWDLFYFADITADGGALPLDIWLGYEDDFALSGQGGSVVAASGAMYKQFMDDGRLAVVNAEHGFLIDPNLRDADVVTIGAIASGLKVNIPAAPYYAFNIDGGSALIATTMNWRIVQKQ